LGTGSSLTEERKRGHLLGFLFEISVVKMVSLEYQGMMMMRRMRMMMN
jgi:hypothetical protein